MWSSYGAWCMARFKNTVADVEVKVLARKNTVLVMKEEVQVVLGKSGSAEQERILIISYPRFSIQFSINKSSRHLIKFNIFV